VIVPLKEPVEVCPKTSAQLSTSAKNNVVNFVIVISPLYFGSQLYDLSYS